MQTGEPVSFTAVESESQPVTRVEGIKSQCRLSLIRRARIGGVRIVRRIARDGRADAVVDRRIHRFELHSGPLSSPDRAG